MQVCFRIVLKDTFTDAVHRPKVSMSINCPEIKQSVGMVTGQINLRKVVNLKTKAAIAP